MFKNKGSLYVLGPVVILIWGTILYKIVVTFGEDSMALPEKPVETVFIKPTVVKDTFSLLPIANDPFLGHSYKNSAVRKSNEETIKKEVVWPEIKYLGMITGEGTTAAVYILQLHGKQLLMEKRGTAQGIRLLNGSLDKIKLKYQGDCKEFSKTK